MAPEEEICSQGVKCAESGVKSFSGAQESRTFYQIFRALLDKP